MLNVPRALSVPPPGIGVLSRTWELPRAGQVRLRSSRREPRISKHAARDGQPRLDGGEVDTAELQRELRALARGVDGAARGDVAAGHAGRELHAGRGP